MKQKQIRHSIGLVLILLPILAAGRLHGQPDAEQALIERARSLDRRGLTSVAVQVWQQVLLAEPNNVEALTSMARAAQQAGNRAEAQRYLDRLRQIAPGNPEIGRIQAMGPSGMQDSRIAQAARLAEAGQYTQAMELYRQVYGEHPPAGEIALLYYDTEAATTDGRPQAVAGLRALFRQFPGDTRYARTLGRVLTYDPGTRAQGEALLRQFPQDAEAQAALRQALLWDARNPAARPAVRAYLKEHEDAQLAASLAELDAGENRANPEVAGDPREAAAYAALHAGRLDVAASEFQSITTRQPGNPRAWAGLGFVRMKQNDFDEAVRDFEQAQRNGLKDSLTRKALDEARFWKGMNEGEQAAAGNRPDVAEARFREALSQRPESPEAMAGLAGVLLSEHRAEEAVQICTRWLKAQPESAPAWRTLFFAQVQQNQIQQALATAARFPPAVAKVLLRDPQYLSALIGAYRSSGNAFAAQQTLARALALPLPPGGDAAAANARLPYAALLMAAQRYGQAADLFREILADAPLDTGAWQGLAAAEHLMGDDAASIRIFEKMPPRIAAAALAETGFLATIAAAYQHEGSPAKALDLLRQAETREAGSGRSLPPALVSQMASLELALGQPEAAYAIYRRRLSDHPESSKAWLGLLSTLNQSGHAGLALTELRAMPASVQQQLAPDLNYLQLLAAIYSSTGHTRWALAAYMQLEARYADQGVAVPAEVALETGWLLFKMKDDPPLYQALMQLGARSDLTEDQRRQVQKIWGVWSARRAAEAVDAGDTRRAIDILDAARQALQNNPAATMSIATGYLKAERPKEALACYRSVDLTGASVPDLQGAIGSALAARDLRQADAWMRYALARYPSDPRVLGMAANYESARGNRRLARQYWQASVAASPETDSVNRLARLLQSDGSRSRRGEDLPAPEALATLLGPGAGPASPSVLIPLPGEQLPARRPAPMEQMPVSLASGPANEPSPLTGEASSVDADGASAGEYRTDSLPANGHAGGQADALLAPPAPVNDIAPQPAEADAANPAPARAHENAQDSGGAYAANPAPAPADASNGPATTAVSRAPAGDDSPKNPDASAPAADLSQGQRLERAEEALSSAADSLPEPESTAGANTPPNPLPDTSGEALRQIASIDGGLSPWLGGTGIAAHRSGTPGFDQLGTLEAPFEASAPFGPGARLTVITRPVFLSPGAADGTSTLQYGTLPVGTIQPEQITDGIATELQWTTANFSARAGNTPYGFLVSNVTGGFRWQPQGGPFTLNFSRDSVTDTQLSYSGIRDPGSATPDFAGRIWGGVIANGGDAQWSYGDAASGLYVGVGGQYLTGNHVLTNTRIHGVAGAYWRVFTSPDMGTLRLGANFFGMHYAHNLRYFTYGQGGYFSPDAFLLASLPLDWTGHYGNQLHYHITATIGAQGFSESATPYFPLDPGLQTAFHNPYVSARASIGANYDLRPEFAYAVGDHWYLGGFLDFNNTRDYQSQSGGFFVRYLFRQQTPSDDGPTGLFPASGFRPLLVP